MALDPEHLDDAVLAFLAERHLATVTVLRGDSSPHVTPVGFTWDDEAGLARVITWSGAAKVAHLERGDAPRAAVCQVDGGRWLTLEGPATVTDDPDRCAEAESRYGKRYQAPKQRDDRRVIEIRVDKILGRA